MLKWLVGIGGDEFTLESLPKNFIHPNLKIIEVDGHYYLSSQEFEEKDDSENIREIASKNISLLNAINKLQNPTSNSVSLTGVVRHEDEDGKITYSVQKSLKIMWNVRGVDILGSSNETDAASPIKSRWANVAFKNEKIWWALSLLNSSNLTWDILYKIFEIIESEFGSEIYNFKGISKKEVDRFSRTYNSSQALGDKSRHPGKDHLPPKNPMIFKEANDLIRILLSQRLSQ